MSVYSDKTKGWRYDFVLKGKRYSAAGFKTKRDAVRAEARKREEIELAMGQPETTDMVFLDLVNLRLDHVKAYNSESHYVTYRTLAKGWLKRWKDLRCSEITPNMVQHYMLERRKVSAYTANKDLRYLRATFNYGLRKGYVVADSTKSVEFFPEEKKPKYVPPVEDVDKVIAQADPDTQDYLLVVRDTLARIGEINALTWDDVNFERGFVTLFTRKKRGGHRTPRRVAMTTKVREILERRFKERDPSKPWVFWHRYWSRRDNDFVEGPYRNRNHLMPKLCERAGVRPFTYHGLRHAGASLMDLKGVPFGSIQRILGHENRKTTEIYLHSIGEADREAMRVLEAVREKSHTSPTP